MFEKVKEILVEEMQIDPNDIKPESELANDLGINSLELADLIVVCEEKFNIEINEEDFHKFIKVSDVVDYLNSIAQ